jgi:hypothetical protein
LLSCHDEIGDLSQNAGNRPLTPLSLPHQAAGVADRAPLSAPSDCMVTHKRNPPPFCFDPTPDLSVNE